MTHRFRPHVVRLAAGILFTFSLFPAEAGAAEPPAFRARFENDAEGMWLVYPTVAGWHYKLESSPTPDEVAGSSQFSFVPGSFRYGSGLEERWWIAPPAAVPEASLPPRTTFYAKLGVHVSNNTTPPEVEIVSYDAQDAVKWSTEVPGTLPVPLNRSLFVLGDSATTSWLFVGQAESMPIESFHGPSVHVPGSPYEAEIAFVLGHWNEILGDLTPTPDDALLNPPQVPYGGTVPLPDPPRGSSTGRTSRKLTATATGCLTGGNCRTATPPLPAQAIPLTPILMAIRIVMGSRTYRNTTTEPNPTTRTVMMTYHLTEKR